MNKDEEQLRLLAVFHYVVGGLIALFAGFGLIYLTIGVAMLVVPEMMDSSGNAPPAFFGLFTVIEKQGVRP